MSSQCTLSSPTLIVKLSRRLFLAENPGPDSLERESWVLNMSISTAAAWPVSRGFYMSVLDVSSFSLGVIISFILLDVFMLLITSGFLFTTDCFGLKGPTD